MEEKLERIRELGSQSRKHLCDLREEESLLSSRLLEVAESKARSLREIRGVFVSLREALGVRERALEQEVEELSKSVSFSLDEERERSRVWQGQLSVLGECVEELESWVESQTQTRSQVQAQTQDEVQPKASDTQGDVIFSTTNLSASSTSQSLSCLSKAMMVNVCLLEDALNNALTSSKTFCTLISSHSSSIEEMVSSKRTKFEVLESDLSRRNRLSPQKGLVSHLQDRVNFTFCFPSTSSVFSDFPSKLLSSSHSSSTDFSSLFSLFLESISWMGFVSSSSFLLLTPVDWSMGRPQHVFLSYQKATSFNKLDTPSSLASSGKFFYLTDSGNNRILGLEKNSKTELKGRLETGFDNPTCVCYHEGFLFIVEHNNHRVQVCRGIGSMARSLGTGKIGSDDGQLSYPRSCMIYNNHLFVSEEGNHRIQKFSLPDLTHVLTFGSEGDKVGQLSEPWEMAVFNGKLYVADFGNDRLSIFDPDTGEGMYVLSPPLSNGETLTSPRGLLVSHELLFVSSDHRISVLNTNDQCLYSFGSKRNGKGQFISPSGMTMVEDILFVCDHNNRIQAFEKV